MANERGVTVYRAVQCPLLNCRVGQRIEYSGGKDFSEDSSLSGRRIDFPVPQRVIVP